MITYEWRKELTSDEADEIRDLVADSASYDSEAEFSQVEPVGRSRDSVWKILVRIHPPERNGGKNVRWPLAAYMQIITSGPVATVELVVRPQYRSLGVSTLLLERLGLQMPQPQGWLGTGATELQVWAHGAHPAADRMANRFTARRARVLWQVMKHFQGEMFTEIENTEADDTVTVSPVTADSAAELKRLDAALAAEGAVDWLGPPGTEHALAADDALLAKDVAGLPVGSIRLVRGNYSATSDEKTGGVLCLSIDPSRADGSRVACALLNSGLRHLQCCGVTGVALHVDANDEKIVQLSRRLGFAHNRSDICYTVGDLQAG